MDRGRAGGRAAECGAGRGVCDGRVPQRSERGGARGVDAGDVRIGPCAVVDSGQAGARQALDRGCRGLCEPRSRACTGSLRGLCADDFGAGSGPHGRHAGQAGGDTGRHCHAGRGAVARGGATGRLCHRRRHGRHRTGGPAALCGARRDVDGGFTGSDHGLDPVEKAGGGAGRAGSGCKGRLWRIHEGHRGGARAGAGAGGYGECRRLPDAGNHQRHEPAPGPEPWQCPGSG